MATSTEARKAAQRARAAGERVSPFRGVHVPAEHADDLWWIATALQDRLPRAVLTGDAAAALTFWPERPVRRLHVSARTKLTHPLVRFDRGAVPTDLVRSVRAPGSGAWLRVTAPALTALDLAVATRGDSIDTVLRTRAATVADVSAALELTSGRVGRTDVRALLAESRDGAWSGAERRLHQILRDARITGWRANAPVRFGNKAPYFVDVLFDDVILEADGYETHSSREAFHRDRDRQNDLVLAGYRVFRFTWEHLQHPHDVVATVRAALARRQA